VAGKQGVEVVVTDRARDVGERRGTRAALAAIVRAPEWGLLAGILAVLALIYVLQGSNPTFFMEANGRKLLQSVAMFGVLAVGAAVVIVAGGIDLSVGSVVALSAVVAAKLMTAWLPGATRSGGPIAPVVVAEAVAITLAMGLAIGLAHSYMINYLRLPPFIATLATLAGLRSVAIVVSNNQPVNARFLAFRVIGDNNYYTVSIFAAVALTMSVVMGATVLGRHLYALGGNEAAARLSGLPVRRLKATAYGLSGMLSALGGLLFAARAGQGDGTMGVGYELTAITAAVVGGCSLAGGIGSIRGTVLGLVLIRCVIQGTGLVVTRIDPSHIEGLVLGTIIVVAVAFNQRFRARS
jgi:ribose/xylose/arabinose/galactoside ABC-type transport system permease subunit